MSRIVRLYAKVCLPWWTRPYVYGLVILARLGLMEPDANRAVARLMRALRVRLFEEDVESGRRRQLHL
jgi:hypothetical protein